ncbi:hypothetical protein AB0D74_45175 [Streptomyces sp. NPDC048278]|uniref:hypothetical protein n=1 Tax=Streptomyces sp. NPDC048278 TaxID=3155809 RepID=UPI00342B627E
MVIVRDITGGASCSPSDPTGAVRTAGDLTALAGTTADRRPPTAGTGTGALVLAGEA